mgnify:CR=1 FL=1
MIHFHYCQKYTRVVDKSIDKSVRKFLEDYSNRNSLKGIGKISSFTKSIFVLLIKRPPTEIILQEERMTIEEKEEVFYFVRDLKGGLSDYVEIRDGKWTSYNPLPEEEKELAIENFKKSKLKSVTKNKPPEDLISWQRNYKLNVKYKVYESEQWVRFASNNSPENGMIYNDVKLYGIALEKILNDNQLIDREKLNSTNNSKTYSFILNDVGIIYTVFNLEGQFKYLLEIGANIKTQNEYWKEQEQQDYSKFYEENKINTVSDLSSISLKAYPAWVLKDLDLWFKIEKNDEVGNLSLLPEQTTFLQDFKFPKYINGQAGSGKSTMLYYLFANSYYYKYADEIKGDILFLTENKKLLKHTQDAVYDLLLNNPEFDLTSEDIAIVKIRENFKGFKDFLLDFLPSDNEDFDGEYLDFSKFKLLYEKSTINKSIKNKYSAELVWFVITTYVYGYDLGYTITSENYNKKMPKEGKELINLSDLKNIEDNIISPFYNKLLEEKGYWDKITLIKYLSKNNLINKSFEVIFCDEAQDFCRVELNFILKLSSYVKYDLSGVEQFPIVFAGDALQTVNPTGFKTSVLTSMIHKELSDLGYNIKGDNIDFTPKYNYRSSQTIVNLANAVQYYRKTELGADVKSPQKSKRPTFYKNKNLNVFVDVKKLIEDKDLQRKLKNKTIILPVNYDFIETYKIDNPILKKYNNLISAVDTKGIDFKEVAIFGFGTKYDQSWGIYEKRFFFNKLYVAVTRAQAELVIIDSLEAKNTFWKNLVDKYLNSKWVGEAPIKLKEFEDIISDTGDIIQSSDKVVTRDAERQKIQGEQDRNIPLLKLASSHFIKLGKEKEYYLCLAIIEEIKENWEKAGEYFLKKEVGEEGIEKAADAYWKGQLWGKLRNLSGTLTNEKSQLRLLIAKLFGDDRLTSNDLKLLNNKKEDVRKILDKTPWREQIVKKFLSLIEESSDDRYILIIGEILEHICYAREDSVWKILGEKYFEIGRYELAVNTFEKGNNVQSVSLLKAKLELAKRKNNIEEVIVWLGRIILKTKIDNFNEVLEFYSRNNTKIEKSDNIYAWLYIYFAFLVKRSNSDELLPLAIKIERYFENKEGGFADELGILLENFNFDDKVFGFLLERWAKNSIIGGITLDGFNERYQELTLNKDIDFIPFREEEIQNLLILPENIGDQSSDHIQNIKINNFRRFKNIQVSNLGKFNLIVGDNNIGKTSLLEALLFIPDKKEYLQRLAFSHIERINLYPEKKGSSLSNNSVLYYNLNKDFLQEFQHCDDDNNNIVFLIKEGRNKLEYELFFSEKKKVTGTALSFTAEDYTVFENLSYLNGIKQPFMPYGKGFSNDLASVYDADIRPKRALEDAFKKNMKVFIPRISQIFAGVDGNIDIRDDDFPEDRPLHQYGEGANKLFRILILLTLHKGKRLMIDEIDAGIHYSKFKEFWMLIIKIAKKDKTQIFATTHNDECIRYFSEVLNELDEEYQKDGRVVQMKLVNNKIKVRSYEYASFNLAIDEGVEIRGGQIL